jgi:hypothetical protein
LYHLLVYWVSELCDGDCADIVEDQNDTQCTASSPSMTYMIEILCQYIEIAQKAFETHEKFPFLALLIQLLWDNRTSIKLRYVISFVLIQLMTNPSDGDSTNRSGSVTTVTHISSIVGRTMLSRIESLLPSSSKKRKRQSAVSDEDESCSTESPAHTLVPSPQDLRIILSVLSCIPSTSSNDLNELVPNYSQCLKDYLHATEERHGKTGKVTVHDLQFFSILTSLLHLLNSRSEQLLLYDMIVTRVLVSLRVIENEPNNETPSLIEYNHLWTWTTLHYVRLCSRFRKEEQRFTSPAIARTIDLMQLLVTDAAIKATGKNDIFLSVIAKAIDILGLIGGLMDRMELQQFEEHQLMQHIAGSFHTVLSSPYWTIRSYAMTSLVQFASSIPSRHKSMLPKCVPSSMQRLLQCRLRHTIWFHDKSNEYNVLELQKQSIDLLYGSMQRSCFVRQPFGIHVSQEQTIDPSSTSAHTLPIGSYCMTMPTQEGRTALIVFPPGRTSIDDIRTMLDHAGTEENGIDDEEWMKEYNVQQLIKQTVLSLDTPSFLNHNDLYGH